MSAAVETLAARLIAARHHRQALSREDCLALQITDRADAWAVQRAIWRQHNGDARPTAWKIGNAGDHASPVFAPMPEVLANHSWTPRARFRLTGIECEIAVRFASALPPRTRPYPHDEVFAAIASLHAAIEIVDTAYADYAAAGPVMGLADNMLHGSFVLGEPLAALDTTAGGAALPWSALTAQSFIDDRCVAAATGGHPQRDPLTHLAWWVNEGSHPWGGVQAGDLITTGTWNGMHFAETPQSFEARFVGPTDQLLGHARVSFTT